MGKGRYYAPAEPEAEKKPFFEPKTEHKPFFEPKAAAPVAPAKPVPADSHEAGLQSIRQAINLLKTHSAANIGGSMLSEALGLLEHGYGVLAPKKV